MTNVEAYNEMVNKMVDLPFVFDVAKENKLDEFSKRPVTIDVMRYLNCLAQTGLVKVNVNRGRKWKGEGYLVGTTEKSFNTGWRNLCTIYCKIYDPTTNKIETIAYHNVTNFDYSKVKEIYINSIKETVKNLNLDKIEKIAWINPITLSFVSSLNIDILREIDNALSSITMDFSSWIYSNHNFMNTEFNLETAIDEVEEAKKIKNAAFKANKMPQLIEWVKTHTDKKGDEITKLAEHIFNKRYGNNDE